MSPASVGLLVFAATAAAAGQILFKLGADGKQQLADFINAHILIGLACYGVGTVVWIYVLSSEKLVNVFSFTALTFALVYVGGAIIDGEGMTPAGMAGMALILAGLYLVTNFNG